LNEVPAGSSHLVSFRRMLTEVSQSLCQLVDVSHRIEQAGFAMPDELAP
jgi:hypothetical protein